MCFQYQIPKYPNYLMDSDGRIFSLLSSKILKPIVHSTGYNVVRLTGPHGTKTLRYHRVVAITLIPNLENLPDVNHKDGDKRNNHPSNLEWCTPKQNTSHAIKIGLMSDGIGVKNNSCKVDREIVESWLKQVLSGTRISDIARKFNVNRNTIARLIEIEFPGVLPKYSGNWKDRRIS